jgi:hypothetical protein
MPDKWPLANGNWSNAANWNGGTKPVAGDDVFADNRTVNVDESFIVATLRSTQRSGGTGGGSFTFSSGSISGSITAAFPIFTLSNQPNLIITATEGTVTLIFSPGASLTQGGGLITYSGNCNLTIQGNPIIGGATSANGGFTIDKTSAGTLIITGSIVGTSSGTTTGHILLGIRTNSSNTIISGSVIGATSGTSHVAISQAVGNLTIIGDVTAGSIAGGHAISTSTPGTITITGSVTGASGAGTGNAILCSSAATINISGSITSGTTSALSLSGASVLTHRGTVTPTNNNPAVISSNTSATNIFTGPFVNTNDTMAVQCADINLTADASTTWNFGNITLFSPERLAFYPSASDIRQGTTYADGTVSGSLAMPPPSAVIAGTPTDNTTGSAVLTPTQLQDAVWGRDLSQMTETGSIGNRLARVSTTGTTGAQIASYLL